MFNLAIGAGTLEPDCGNDIDTEELACEPVRHGALSTAQGVVHLTWRLATEAGRNALHLHWKEENGPAVT